MVLHKSRQTTSDTVYEYIKKRIIELEYEPDEHLVEESLTAQLGVSRTPLRQALYRLELEGLLVKKSNGRIYVAPISIKEAKEIFRVREVLEGLTAREATLNTKDELVFQRLEDTLYLMRNAAENNRQIDVVHYGSEFHQQLQQQSDNVTAAILLDQIMARISRYRRLGAYRDPNYSSLLPVQEHEEILGYMKRQDVDMAEKAMRSHIKRSYESTVAALKVILDS
ncbi:GntR family transcriptional regulator [Bacillus horti]|uniref:DNA-binding GntR family transcriptional regulator n=1 Tax=Caldalkalibacillus horti TaxID=77523 RepID=A0ABT9VTQ4_9BACI|nr:GntR family transcriptional regulator [Bacillus horti]MDQ0164358.1 DNA-binding GntR family transcriptional regulator [Bacillus horti]